ncbi:MAG: sigma-70 family RNA polymerase sigma factor [Planctomycetes bacterium]|nr:sigma-70 family RNA polymerase sigma factor [Planctomycetota bacterium]
MADGAPDREVLERARRGDRRALGAIVETCGDFVLGLAFRMTRDRSGAEDLAQEVFVRLMRALPRYDPGRPFLPWLRTVATNQILHLLTRGGEKERRRTASLEACAEAAGSLPPDPAAEAAPAVAEARERAEAVRRAVRRLPPDQRAIVALRYFRGLGYEELARELSLPLGTVKNRLFRAREALAAELGETKR